MQGQWNVLLPYAWQQRDSSDQIKLRHQRQLRRYYHMLLNDSAQKENGDTEKLEIWKASAQLAKSLSINKKKRSRGEKIVMLAL